MNIQNFGQHINRLILNRGRDYYYNNNVLGHREYEKGQFLLVVEGTRDYQVHITLDAKKNIIESTCNCPYNSGPICKHEVAAYYYLSEKVFGNQLWQSDDIDDDYHNYDEYVEYDEYEDDADELDMDYDMDEETIENDPYLSTILMNLDKETLIQIIQSLSRSKEERYQIAIQHEKIEEKAEGQMLEWIQVIQHIYHEKGYLNPQKISTYLNSLDVILDRTNEVEDVVIKISVLMAVYQELCMALMQAFCPDYGPLAILSKLYVMINKVVVHHASWVPDIQHAFFQKLYEAIVNTVFPRYQQERNKLLKCMYPFMSNPLFRNSLDVFFTNTFASQRAKRMISSEDTELMKFWYEIKREFEESEKLSSFISRYNYFPFLRFIQMEQCFVQEDYEKLIQLASNIGYDELDYHDRIKLLKIQFEGYAKLERLEELIPITMKLMQVGEVSYYERLKEISKVNPYPILLELLKDERNTDLYLRVVEQEHDLVELLSFVRERDGYLERYALILADVYRDEVSELMLNKIRNKAVLARTRGAYHEVCTLIVLLGKVTTINSQIRIVDELCAMYGSRRLFVQLLRDLLR